MSNPVTKTVVVAAPRELVWELATTNDSLKQWWWPMWDDVVYDIRPKYLGRWRIHSPSRGVGVHGEYIVIDKPHRLEFLWVWEDPDRPTTGDHVLITFAEADDGTEIRVQHTVTDGDHTDHEYDRGWDAVLERFRSLTQRRMADPSSLEA